MSQSSLEFTQQAVAHCSSPREITGVVFNIVIAKQLVSQFGQQLLPKKPTACWRITLCHCDSLRHCRAPSRHSREGGNPPRQWISVQRR